MRDGWLYSRTDAFEHACQPAGKRCSHVSVVSDRQGANHDIGQRRSTFSRNLARVRAGHLKPGNVRMNNTPFIYPATGGVGRLITRAVNCPLLLTMRRLIFPRFPFMQLRSDIENVVYCT